MSKSKTLSINRAPVLTLWATLVAERLGFVREEALTLGKAVAGLNAHSKGRSLGLYEPARKSLKELRESARRKRAAGAIEVALLQRAVAMVPTPQGLRALVKDKPVDPAGVERYLHGKFGEDLAATEAAMRSLAASRTPARLAAEGYSLYERFRPEIPAGVAGWGAAGTLDLGVLAKLERGGPTRQRGAASRRLTPRPTSRPRASLAKTKPSAGRRRAPPKPARPG